MIRTVTFLLFWVLMPCSLLARETRPRLVVGIVVDQMRWDYLYRFAGRYGSGGFNRLLGEGFSCEQTFINYLPSFTAPGHASIYTGSVPALNGIVANEWIDRQSGRAWYCTEDTTAKGVGGGAAGRMSPRNLLATTITDELRLATNFQSRVFSISLKDRGAILPGGHTANAAFWYDGESGKFITSDYYMQSLPDWVKAFNQRKVADSLLQQVWRPLFPIATYRQSSPDDNPYEGVLKGQQPPVFPHQAAADKGYDAIRYLPFGNTLTRLMAEACISANRLGEGSATDFLAVSFSATDYIGHLYGPNSIEVEDTYLRLDKEIARLLDFLDQTLGKDNYLVFLTADHGAAHNARFLKSHQIPAGSLPIATLRKALNNYLQSRFKAAGLIRSLMNYQVFFNEDQILKQGLDRAAIRRETINWLKSQNEIAIVLDLQNPEQNSAPRLLETMATNGYYYRRCGDIQLIMKPAWYSGYAPTGTTHGSWNPYDTHIPLLWYGKNIPHGKSYQKTSITDIAPTLAALLQIQIPNACTGKVIKELMK